MMLRPFRQSFCEFLCLFVAIPCGLSFEPAAAPAPPEPLAAQCDVLQLSADSRPYLRFREPQVGDKLRELGFSIAAGG